MSHHPNSELLKLYATGEIDSAHGAAIASHIESCSECRAKVMRFEAEAGEAMMSLSLKDEKSSKDLELVFSNMLDDIMTLDADYSKPKVRKPGKVQVDGKEFTVPATIAPLVERMSEWRSYGGKVFTSTIDVDEECRVSLLYINQGVQVPQHTHKGFESTLVLHGSFKDENGEYHVGDFIREDGETKHAPQTVEGQDCLCLSILTEPMIFTQGVARVFNMFGKGMYP
ncbi:ChrR family anti-sigma-E factor [Vibrio sp. La 4.2.2]|uniref:ChrR family anti-sigma-E factor n=1 Tax=Vibrio sp. La 4.2.2 TaxID=2998830 RepID=UPI0022CE300B|nr:ChrR family anti-sigma-E factor [Vibrio sp. La 4.2.2]MDA0110768.1 ChrR family anti-sigma-E factor [Vibrio sp. La 4.2.2]